MSSLLANESKKASRIVLLFRFCPYIKEKSKQKNANSLFN